MRTSSSAVNLSSCPHTPVFALSDHSSPILFYPDLGPAFWDQFFCFRLIFFLCFLCFFNLPNQSWLVLAVTNISTSYPVSHWVDSSTSIFNSINSFFNTMPMFHHVKSLPPQYQSSTQSPLYFNRSTMLQCTAVPCFSTVSIFYCIFVFFFVHYPQLWGSKSWWDFCIIMQLFSYYIGSRLLTLSKGTGWRVIKKCRWMGKQCRETEQPRANGIQTPGSPALKADALTTRPTNQYSSLITIVLAEKLQSQNTQQNFHTAKI